MCSSDLYQKQIHGPLIRLLLDKRADVAKVTSDPNYGPWQQWVQSLSMAQVGEALRQLQEKQRTYLLLCLDEKQVPLEFRREWNCFVHGNIDKRHFYVPLPELPPVPYHLFS